VTNIISRNDGKNTQVAFVFSCPGAVEEKSKILVNGVTGSNLTKLIEIIRKNEMYKNYFDSENRYDYRITNASEIVHYKKKDGISEASDKEIMSQKNIERLIDDLIGFSVIITFGDKSYNAVKYCENKIGNTKIINVRHLSMLSINQIKYDCNGIKICNPNKDKNIGKKNTYIRLNTIAKKITAQI